MSAESCEMIRVAHRGFDVWCDGYRTVGSQLVFLSMFGVQTSVRALWAHVVGSSRPSLELGGNHLTLDNCKYSTLRSLLDHQYLHLVVIHPNATSLVSPFREQFYLLGERPAEQYWSRFNRMCNVPMRQSWRDVVWQLGVKHALITPLDGMGAILGYDVDTGAKWADVVRAAVKAGELS